MSGCNACGGRDCRGGCYAAPELRGTVAEELVTLRKAYDLSNATNSRLVVQLDGLQAQVHRLREHVRSTAAREWPSTPNGAKAAVLLKESPAQSVARIEAAALERHAGVMMSVVGEENSPETNEYYSSAAEDARQAAAARREQAAP